MRWLARSLVVVLLTGATTLLLTGPAQADIVFTEDAQEFFPVDADGTTSTDPSAGRQEFRDAWEAFNATEAGRTIWEDLDGNPDVTITITTVRANELGEGEKNGKILGTEQVLSRDDDGNPTEIEIKIRTNRTGGKLSGVADTLFHELRHAQIEIEHAPGGVLSQESREDAHDAVDAYTDPQMDTMLTLLIRMDIAAEAAAKVDPILTDSTPISDAIKARADDDTALRFTAIDIGDILLPDPSPEELRRADVVEVNGVRIRSAIATEIDRAAPGSGCGTSEGDRTILCPDGAGVLSFDDLLGIDVQLDTLDGLFDSHLEIRLEMDTDGEPANSRESQSDTDTAGGTDTTFGALYNPIEGWSMQVYGAGGPIMSDARAVVGKSGVTFLVPMGEVPGGTAAGFRVAAEQTTPDGTTTVDVLGATPAEPLASVPDGPVPAGCGADFLGPVCGAQSQTHISAVSGHLDLAGDLWVEIVFEQPWATFPPKNDLASLLVKFGITTTSGTSSGQLSVHDGTTYASGVYGRQPTELEMYLTPWGSVFIKMLGRDEPGSFSLGDSGPLVVNTLTRYLLTLDGDARERISDFALTTARISTGFAGPGADWTALLVDVGLVILVVPGN